MNKRLVLVVILENSSTFVKVRILPGECEYVRLLISHEQRVSWVSWKSNCKLAICDDSGPFPFD